MAGNSARQRLRLAAVRDGALLGGAVVLAAVAAAFSAAAIIALLVHVSLPSLQREFQDGAVRQALRVSLQTTLLSAAAIVVFGTPVAALLVRPFPGKAAVETLVTLPVVLPPVVAGLALLLAFGRAGLLGHSLALAGLALPFTAAAVVCAQTFVAAPFYILAAKAAFERVDADTLGAAATLGASPAYAFVRVVLQPSAPALVSGAALAFARALGEFGATITFAGNLPGVTQTMPIAVYTLAQANMDASLTVAVLLLALSYGALLLMRVLPVASRRP
jgi:molybdate transport system permease protein